MKAGSSADRAYDQAVAHLECAYEQAMAHLMRLNQGEHVDEGAGTDHINVIAESFVVVGPGDDDNMSVITDVDHISVITDFDHISVITEVPDLGDVEEDDGLVPRFRSIPPLIPPPNTKEEAEDANRARAIQGQSSTTTQDATTQMADGQS